MERPGPAPEVTPDDVLRVFERLDDPCTPLTASEVAGALECSRRTAHRKLEMLAERGDVNSKKTGARGRVWWRPSRVIAGERRPRTDGDDGRWTNDGVDRPELEQFGAFVGAVEDYAIFMLDADGVVINWNEGAERIKGYREAEIVGEHVSTFYTEADVANGVPECNLERAATNGRCEDEGWRVRDDGSRFRANIVITAIRDENGTLQGFTKVTRDLTERREQEQELRKERVFVEKILETAPVSISVLSSDGELVRANSRAKERLGIDESDFDPRRLDSIDHFDADGEPIPEDELPWARAAETRETVSDFQCQIDLPNLGRRWISINALPLEDSEEERVVVVVDDISDRKEHELKLLRERAKSRHRYRALVENFPNGAVALVDDDLRYTTVGGEPIDGRSVTPDDLEGGLLREVLSEELADLLVPRYEAALDGESSAFEQRYNDRVFQFRTLPVRDDEGTVFAAMGMSQDITERKERERTLEEQQERYRRLVDMAPVAIATYDADGKVRFANPAAAELSEVSEPDALVDRHALDFVHPDDRDESAARIRSVIEDREAVPPKESGFLTTQDETKHTVVRSVPTTFDGEPAGQVVLTDITEQKERERELARYETLFEESRDVNAVLEPDGTLRYLTPSVTGVVGYDPDELVGENAFEYVHPDDREAALREFTAMAEGSEYEPRIEFRFRHADGSWVVLEARGRNLLDDPRIEGLVVYTRDVTERRRREEELERYRTIVQTVNDGVYTVDDEGRFVMVNDSYAEMTGYAREELLGERVSKVVDRETMTRARSLEGDLVGDDGDRAKIEADVFTADGDTIRAEATFAMLPTDDGEHQRVGVVRDITERVERERALEESERRYRTLVENFPDGIVALFDEDLQYITAGGQLLGEMGVAIEDVVGSSIWERYSEDLAAEIEPHFRGALAGDVSSFDIEYRGRNLLAHTLPVRNADEEVYAGMLVVQDVTERMEYRRQLEETVDELEESNERLEQFAYVASHDLQEPLRMITNYLQLLEQRYDDVLDEEGEEFIEFAVDGADRMREMISDLLAYSRVDTKADPFEPTDTGSVVETVLDQLGLRIEETDASVDVGELPTVSADSKQLEQVFQNLVSNALKYRGDDPPRIAVDATERSDEWRFQVSDNGIGIDPDHADRIFDVFRRLHTTHEYSGTGIGLSLCRKIVHRHGGEIWVESEPGDGSAFFFTIPMGDDS